MPPSDVDPTGQATAQVIIDKLNQLVSEFRGTGWEPVKGVGNGYRITGKNIWIRIDLKDACHNFADVHFFNSEGALRDGSPNVQSKPKRQFNLKTGQYIGAAGAIALILVESAIQSARCFPTIPACRDWYRLCAEGKPAQARTRIENCYQGLLDKAGAAGVSTGGAAALNAKSLMEAITNRIERFLLEEAEIAAAAAQLGSTVID